MEKEPSLKRSILIGCAVTLFVFLVGFGAMCILYYRWLQTDAHLYPGLKGVFDYKASLWGDAICLPFIVGTGIAFISYFKDCVRNKKSLWFPIVLGILGGLGGTYMQAQWIISDATILNWSIPVQHQFNFAGWWHAVFFVGVCAAVSFIAGYMFIIDLNLAPRKEAARSLDETPVSYFYAICQFIIWFCGLLFLHFHFIDDFASRYKEWMIIGFFSALGILVVLGVKLLINRCRKLIYYGSVIFAIILSAEVALFDITGWPQCNQLFLVCGLLCTATYVYNSTNKLKMIGLFLSFVLLECLCQVQITKYLALEDKSLFFVFFGLCLLVPFGISYMNIMVLEKGDPIQGRKGLFALRFSVYALLMNLTPMLLSHNELDFIQQLTSGIETAFKTVALKSSLVSLFLFILLNSYVRLTFPHIQRMEYSSSDNVKKVNSAKYSQYIVYALAYIAAIVLLWNSLSLKYDMLLLNFVYIAVTIVLVITCYFLIKPTSKPTSAKRSAVFLYMAYFVIIIYLLATRAAIPVTPSDNLLWGNTLMTIYTACNMAVIMALNIIYNVFLLRQKKITTENIGYIIVIGLLSSLCFGLAAYQLFLYQTIYHAIQLTIITLISFCLLPHRYSSVLNPGGDVGIIDKQTASQGVLQDGFLFGIVANANTIISMAILGYLFKESTPSWLDALVICFSYGIGLFPLCHYCMINNVKHKNKLKEKLEGMAKGEDEKVILSEQYDNLEAWLSAQNRLAILLSFPYSLCYYICISVKNLFDPSKGVKKEKPL